MTPDIEHWLMPMLDALLMDKRSGEAFTQFMEAAIEAASDDRSPSPPAAELSSPSTLEEMLGPVTDRRIGTVDWIRLGQLIREELAWGDYPSVPPGSS